MQRYDKLANLFKLILLGTLLLGIVFLIPDAGRMEHRSFFSVARQSGWGQLFEWSAAWCSAKIITLSVAVLLILEAGLTVALRIEQRMACMALLLLAVLALFLGSFGFFELLKAVL